MKITTYCHSDKGKIRATNEDAYGYFSLPNIELFVVCDGMGGHAAGEVASQMAVEAIHEAIRDSINLKPNEKPEKLLRDAILSANKKIWHSGQTVPANKGMGTTCVVAILQNKTLYIGHVGDSRAYLQTGTQLLLLTKDHSYVQRLLDMQIIVAQDIPTHPHRGVITRSLGYEPHLQPEISKPIGINSGDLLLLCSDGITAELTDDEIKNILFSEKAIQEKAVSLVESANQIKGSDNITALVALLEND